MGVLTVVADHSDGLDGQEDGEGLGDLVVEARATQFLDEDVIGLTQGVGIGGVDLAQDAHPQAGTGEGVAIDHVRGQAQFDADLAHLVLEQLPQGFHQPQLHVLRQTADVVVGLDDLGLAGPGAGGFDDVGVDGALGQPFDVRQLIGLGLEDVDEGGTDDLALELRVIDPGQALEKARPGVDADDLDPHVAGEGAHDLIALPQAQQAVIDEDAGQALADGPVQQGGDHGGIHPAGEAEQDLVLPHLLADAGDGILDDVARRPEPGAATDVVDKAGEDALTLAGMGDLGVELEAVEATLLVGDARQRGIVGGADGLEARGQDIHPVAMAHPDVKQTIALRAGVVLDIAQQA